MQEITPKSQEARTLAVKIRLDDRAQFGPGASDRFAGPEKSLRERGAANAIENLIDVDRPFTVRVIVKGDDKVGGSLIDAEIAGRRTMVAYRPDLTVRKIVCRTEGIELSTVQIAPLNDQ